MAHLQAQNPKIKEFLIFWEIELYGSKYLKNSSYSLKINLFVYFLKRKSFLYFQNGTLHFPSQPPQKLKNTQQKYNFLAQILKKFLYTMFPKAEPSSFNIKKVPCNFANERFSYIF